LTIYVLLSRLLLLGCCLRVNQQILHVVSYWSLLTLCTHYYVLALDQTSKNPEKKGKKKNLLQLSIKLKLLISL
jgi:hypothetical protein